MGHTHPELPEYHFLNRLHREKNAKKQDHWVKDSRTGWILTCLLFFWSNPAVQSILLSECRTLAPALSPFFPGLTRRAPFGVKIASHWIGATSQMLYKIYQNTKIPTIYTFCRIPKGDWLWNLDRYLFIIYVQYSEKGRREQACVSFPLPTWSGSSHSTLAAVCGLIM